MKQLEIFLFKVYILEGNIATLCSYIASNMQQAAKKHGQLTLDKNILNKFFRLNKKKTDAVRKSNKLYCNID